MNTKINTMQPGDWPATNTTLNWPYRLLLAGVAFGGSALYAWSFAHVPQREQWLPIASAIGIAAGISWVLFGLLLLAVTRTRPSMLAWVDACLLTMAAGMTIKMTAVTANLILPPGASFHLAVLLTANLAMAGVFIWRAHQLAMRPLLAAALWFGALNGIFAIVLFGLRANGWFR
ncbi:MAG: hypothetical protein QM813_08030 [Verrucomicrobiota bacterium]